MEITVSPKATSYACPLELIDYMAATTAVIAPHSANILDVVEPEDEAALTAPLERVTRDDALRERLATTARELRDGRANLGG